MGLKIKADMNKPVNKAFIVAAIFALLLIAFVIGLGVYTKKGASIWGINIPATEVSRKNLTGLDTLGKTISVHDATSKLDKPVSIKTNNAHAKKFHSNQNNSGVISNDQSGGQTAQTINNYAK